MVTTIHFKGLIFIKYPESIYLNSFMLEKNLSRKIAFLIIFFFMLALIPVLRIGLYNYPSADDYSFGIKTFQVWEATHSVKAVIAEAVRIVELNYQTWQGTYSAIFLMALQPAVFGTLFYKAVPFFLIFLLTASYLWLTHLLLCQILKASKSEWLIICFSLLFLTILFPVSGVEAFYWYNGSIFYNFFFALSIFLISSLLSAIRTVSKVKRTFYCILSVLLSAIIAGGNFTTALIVPLLLILYISSQVFNHKKVPAIVIISLVILLAGLAVNALAPGNQVRQANFTDTPSPIMAILKSIGHGVYELKHWLKLPVFLILVIITPFIHHITRRSAYRYSYPGIFSLLSFGIFCAMFTPPFYAMNMAWPGRLLNICSFAYFWLLILNIFYWSGYLNHQTRFNERLSSLKLNRKLKEMSPRSVGSIFCLLTFCVFGLAMMRSKSTPYIAWKSLSSGEAQQYGLEMEKRFIQYKGPGKEIQVDSLTVKPKLLFFSDITPDKKHWHNQDVAKFFGKESVCVKAD